jgi:hypothetical protein
VIGFDSRPENTRMTLNNDLKLPFKLSDFLELNVVACETTETTISDQPSRFDNHNDPPGNTPSTPLSFPVHQSSVLSVFFISSILSPAAKLRSPSACAPNDQPTPPP